MSLQSGQVRPLSLFLLGGCDIHVPLNALTRVGVEVQLAPFGQVPICFTFGEMFQVIEVLRGERTVPAEIRPLCGMDPNFGMVPEATDFHNVDVFLAEPASSVDLIFRGCYINRIQLQNIVVLPLRELGKEAAKYAGQWLRAGLVGVDEEKRRQAVEKLLPLVPDDLKDAEFIRQVLAETYGNKADVVSALAKLRTLVGRPVGVVVYIFQYLADGRAIGWPAGHHEEILAASHQLGLPVFDPCEIVRMHGVDVALRPDLRHYNDEFSATVMAHILADFARDVSFGAPRGTTKGPA